MKLILASASPRRQALLKQIGADFEVVISDVNEAIDERNPEQLVKKLAQAKAESVAAGVHADIILGADTIVYIDGEILGKPTDEADAFRILKKLSGRAHEVYTGLAILYKSTGECSVTADKTTVYMLELSDDDINAYIASGEPMDKAGAYGVQDRAGIFVERIEGDFFTVVGLPLYRLHGVLKP